MKIRRIWLKDVGPFKELDIEIPPGTRPDRADVVVIRAPTAAIKPLFFMHWRQCSGTRTNSSAAGGTPAKLQYAAIWQESNLY